MKLALDEQIHNLLNVRLIALENEFKADVLTYFGQFEGGEEYFLKIVEDLANDPDKRDTIYILLTTAGGSVTVVERFVNILRHNYAEVNFVVPDYAYSAGTVFCMSGNNILMDYFSVLGPIDPQVVSKEGKLVAALGYLDKINELISKAKVGKLTQAEYLILKDFDLAELRRYEQARELTMDLLENWLVKYKFKNWVIHRTDPAKKGKPVSEEEKLDKAKEIAGHLSDNNKWKSHGRPINIASLMELGLEIEDFGENSERRKAIRDYHDIVSNYVNNYLYIRNINSFIHTRKYI